MKRQVIDINADVGEGFDDASIYRCISSCNIACGGHAGSTTSMLFAIRHAKTYNVAIGAHPSYPDKENFGRKYLDIPLKDLCDSLIDQISTLRRLCEQEHMSLHHIKFHGALYHAMNTNPDLTLAILEACKQQFSACGIYAMSNSIVSIIAEDLGIQYANEVFADRSYKTQTELVSRKNENALIKSSKAAEQHLFNLLNDCIRTVDGDIFPVQSQTLCIHSDTPWAVTLSHQVFSTIQKNGIKISPPW